MNMLISFIVKYLGWRNWAVLLYNSAIENVFLIMYVALYFRFSSPWFLFEFFFFFLFSMCSTTYGYLINDLSDREIDSQQGKQNTFRHDSTGRAVQIVALFFILSVIFAIPFFKKSLFLLLWASWFLVTTFYSLKPIRLKERGKVGLIFTVLGQRVLPALIVFSTFGYWDLITVPILTLYILFRGLSSDLNHQYQDFYNDIRTGTTTFAVQAGIDKVRRLLRISLEIEKGMLLICLLTMMLKINKIVPKSILFALPVLLIYIALYASSFFLVHKSTFEQLNPFTCNRKSIFHLLHHTFPSVGLPVYLGILVAFQNPFYILITLFFIVYRRLYSLELILNTFPFTVIKKILVK